MTQDIDVARVAAALRAPVIRYRNFGNVPVRGTFQPPPTEISVEAPGLDSALAEAVALQREEEARAIAAPVPHSHQQSGQGLTEPGLPQSEPINQPQVDNIDIAATTWIEAVPLTVIMQPGVVVPEAALKSPVADLPPAETILPAPRTEAFQARPLPVEPVVLEGASAPEDGRPLLEVLREASLQPAPAQQGLLALLAQPAIWDRPASQPPAMVPGPLSGQPIATDAGGLLSSAGFGVPAPAHEKPAPPISQPYMPQPAFVPYQEPAQPYAPQQNFVLYQEAPQLSVPQSDFVPYQEPTQPYAPQQSFVPYQEAPQAYVPQSDFVPYQEPTQQSAPQPDFVPYQEAPQPYAPQQDFVPFQQPPQPYALQPEAQVQPPSQPSSAQVKPPAASLADVFRKVRAPAAQPAEAKQNAALHNVLRGLRAGRQD
jgi:hypothetical protein